MALINLRNALMAGKRLPYDAEVEYLESTGTQWIDTGLDYFADFEIGIKLRTSVPNKALGTSFNTCLQRYSANNPYWDLQISGRSYRSRASIVDYHVMSWKSGVFATDGVSEYTVSNPFASGTMTLFGAGGSYYPNMIYSCKLWDANGTLVRDFIPVRKGTVGYLYDRVSGKFFGNAGTGDFVVGQDVVPVEWLSSDGAQYIDTGYVFQFGDDVSATFQPLATPTQTAYFFGADTAYNAGLNVHYDPSNSSTGLRYCYGGGFAGYNTGIAISPVQAFSTSTIYACNGNANKRTINSGENTASVQDSGLNNASVILFCGRRNANVRPASTGWAVASRFFGFDAKRNGAGVRAMKPVRVGTEGAMMDVLTRRIYRNAGTGAFTYGNDLKYPIPAE